MRITYGIKADARVSKGLFVLTMLDVFKPEGVTGRLGVVTHGVKIVSSRATTGALSLYPHGEM
jgi:hypothetical protein